MNIAIRRLYCVQEDDSGFWTEDDGRNICEYPMPEDATDDEIRESVLANLACWSYGDRSLAEAIRCRLLDWCVYGMNGDLEIIVDGTREPLFHISITTKED